MINVKKVIDFFIKKEKNKYADSVKEYDFLYTFPPLGHPEHHFNKYPNHPWLRRKKEIKEWILNNISECSDIYSFNKVVVINNDLTVSFKYKATIEKIISYIPIQIRECEFFCADKTGLVTLIGSPYVVNDLLANENKIESFEGVTKNINYILELSNNKIKDFKKMPKFESSVFIEIDNNPIVSWDGFQRCESLSWWQKEWCNETSYSLLMNTPKMIRLIWCTYYFNSTKIVKVGNDKIDMSWLNKEQKRIEEIKNMESNINISVKFENTDSKKRKL